MLFYLCSGKRKRAQLKWTAAEKAEVRKLFSTNILLKCMPTKKEIEDKKQEATIAFRNWRSIREHLRFYYKLEGTHTMPKFK